MSEIKDVGTQYNDLLAGFVTRTLGTNNDSTGADAPVLASEPVATGAQVTQEPVTVEPPTAAEPAQAAPNVTTPAEPEPSGTDVWTDWDDQAPTEPAKVDAQPQSVAPNLYNDLSKALGQEVKSTEDLVQLFKAESVKAKAWQDSLPSELKKAIDLASKGGDYLEYLKVNTVDYSSADPVELYEDYVIDSAADKDGNVDSEKVNEYLNGLDDFEKRLRGQDLQRRLVAEQKRRSVEIEQEAVRTKEKYDTELKSVLRGFNEIDGFKVDDNHRRELFEWISSGGIMKDLFYTADGQFDAAKAAKVAFRNKYYDKLDTYHKTKIRNATKREVLKDITNQQMTTPSKFADPTPKKGISYSDIIQGYGERLKGT